MRRTGEQTGALFTYLSPEGLVPRDHPARPIRLLVNAALEKLSPRRGLPRVGWVATLTAASCNLLRLPKLMATAG